MAKTIFKSMETNREIEVLSRGVVVLFPEPTNPKVEAVLNNHNLNLEEHIATQLQHSDIDDNTLILTMTLALKNTILKQYTETKNVYVITEFVGESGDVLDPYGGTLAEYEACYVELAKLVKKTVYKIDEME